MAHNRRSFLLGLGISLITVPAFGRDDPVDSLWDKLDPELAKWFRSLRMPDNEKLSCCGEADVYWADSYRVDQATGNWVAIITDTRPDEPRKRRHIPVGTEFVVPKHKLYGQFDPNNPTKKSNNPGNPTGHGIIFINPYALELMEQGHKIVNNRIVPNEHTNVPVVYCYLQPGGI